MTYQYTDKELQYVEEQRRLRELAMAQKPQHQQEYCFECGKEVEGESK